MITKEEFKEFVEAFGWEEREVRSSSMWAFKKDEMSLNYYPSTGTLTVQKKTDTEYYGVFIINEKRVRDLVRVEQILEKTKQ